MNMVLECIFFIVIDRVVESLLFPSYSGKNTDFS